MPDPSAITPDSSESTAADAVPAVLADTSARFYVFWSINGPLELDRLVAQLEDFKEFGYDGVVWHPRFYPNDPPYLSDAYLAILSDVILAAQRLGLEVWMYDENGWPAGTVGGELPRRYPQFRGQWLELRSGEPHTAEDVVSTFLLPSTVHDGPQSQVRLVRVYHEGLDFLNPKAAQTFIQMTHERLRTGLAPAAFAAISTFFTDEPALLDHAAYGAGTTALPWTDALPARYRERHGDDLLALLPHLILPLPGHETTRVRYRELCADLLRDGFLAPCAAWCRTHGKGFTGHPKGEEHPLFQVAMNGGCQTLYPTFTLPGIDALERYPHDNFYPRQAATVAAQVGNGRVMAECFGGAGWGATPEDLQTYLEWLGSNGVTDFVIHLCQYRLTSEAIRDWPPSIPLHMSWRDLLPDLFDDVRVGLQEMRADLVERAEAGDDSAVPLLVVAPYRAVMAGFDPAQLVGTDIHKGEWYPDSPAQAANDRLLTDLDTLDELDLAWHVVDERTFEALASLDSSSLTLGRMTYTTVLIGPDCRLGRDAERLVETFVAVGGKCLRGGPDLPPVPFRQVETTSEKVIDATITWDPTPPLDNALIPDVEADPVGEPGWFRFTFVADRGLTPEVIFVDPVAELTLDGKPIEVVAAGRLCVASFTVPDLAGVPPGGRHLVRVRCPGRVSPPVVSLLGKFRVTSATPWEDAPNGCVRTAGPWRIASPAPLADPGNLLTAGYPFAYQPILLSGAFSTRRKHEVIGVQLTDIHADAAFIAIDGEEIGWVWGPDFQAEWEHRLPPGRHAIEIELFPSTYNFYGPHHHYEGDRPLVSPGQFTGVRNFADPQDAPLATHVAAWHFRPFGIAPTVRLLPPREAEID